MSCPLALLVVGGALVSSPAWGQVTPPTSPPPNLTQACPGERQIGLNPSPGLPCPSSADPRWRRSRLFPQAAVGASELRKYCVYDWTGLGAPVPATLPTAGHPSPSGWLDPECAVVAPLSHPYADNNAVLNESAFLAQVEEIVTPIAAPARASAVIVVDSAVDAAFPHGGRGVDDHGAAMSAIIRRLACPTVIGAPGFCAASVATHLGLPLVRPPSGGFRVDRRRGGYFGRPSDIAAALHAGLHRALNATSATPIIINLSLGWDAAWGGPNPSGGTNLGPSLASVYSAIVEARCQGALVVVAAGNDPGGPSILPGPAYPAGWEMEPAPDALRCATVGGGPYGPAAITPYQPLVHAVAGVDGADVLLANARPGSRPRLVAPAGHVAISLGSGYTSRTYTGSSVAAAAVSSVAAAVWAYQPALSGPDVMQRIYDAGIDLGLPVETCLSGACSGTTHRVSMCHAVADACLASGRCTPPPCPPKVAGRDLRARGHDVSTPPALKYRVSGASRQTLSPPCLGTLWTTNLAALGNPCPRQQYYSAYLKPYAAPQPIVAGCPNCLISLSSRLLVVGITSDLDGMVLNDPVLRLEYPGDVIERHAVEGLGPIYEGDEFEVEMADIDTIDLEAASIEFVSDQGDLVSAPLLLLP